MNCYTLLNVGLMIEVGFFGECHSNDDDLTFEPRGIFFFLEAVALFHRFRANKERNECYEHLSEVQRPLAFTPLISLIPRIYNKNVAG